MIRDFPVDEAKIKANIITIDNEHFENCDIPREMIGDKSVFVSFWYGICLVVIPMHQIKKICLFNEEVEA